MNDKRVAMGDYHAGVLHINRVVAIQIVVPEKE
jgi:hypothetical protein